MKEQKLTSASASGRGGKREGAGRPKGSTKENTKKFCKLAKDEFFYFDIIGLEIYENSQILGVVSDIVETGANYLFEVSTSQNLTQNGLPKTFFVPYIDNFVEKISLDEAKIYTKNAKAILENS